MQDQLSFSLSMVLLLLLLAVSTTVIPTILRDNRAVIATRYANILGALSYIFFSWGEIPVCNYFSYILSGLSMTLWGALPVLRIGEQVSKIYIAVMVVINIVGNYLPIFVFVNWNIIHVSALSVVIAALYAFPCLHKQRPFHIYSYLGLYAIYGMLFFFVIGRSFVLLFFDHLVSDYTILMFIAWPALITGITFFIVTSYLEEAYAEAALSAQKDPLTQVYNRNGFAAHTKTHIARARRFEDHFSLFVCDLDKFKRVNDNYGHAFGDRALQALVAAIKSEARADTILARFGGDEFVAALPNSSRADAILLIERIKLKISSIVLYTDAGIEVRFTVSFGLASTSRDHDISRLLTEADVNLYQEKRKMETGDR